MATDTQWNTAVNIVEGYLVVRDLETKEILQQVPVGAALICKEERQHGKPGTRYTLNEAITVFLNATPTTIGTVVTGEFERVRKQREAEEERVQREAIRQRELMEQLEERMRGEGGPLPHEQGGPGVVLPRNVQRR